MTIKKLIIARLALGVFVLVVVAVAVLTRQVDDASIEEARQAVEGLGPWGPLAIGAFYVFATALLVPGLYLVTLGTAFVYGVGVGAITISIGSTAGSTLSFLLGRGLFRRALEERFGGSPRFAAFDRAIAEGGFRIVLLTRLNPVFPYVYINYVYSLTRVRVRDYVLATWLGMLPAILTVCATGAAARSLTDIVEGRARPGVAMQVLVAVGVLTTIVATVLVTRRARRELAALDPALGPAAGPAADPALDSAAEEDPASGYHVSGDGATAGREVE